MDDPHQIYIDQLMLLADEGEDPAASADLRQHVNQCGDCQKELAGLRRLSRMLGEALASHPEVDSLVAWAADPNVAGDIGRHVAECPMCEAHVEMLREESGRPPVDAPPEILPAALRAQLAKAPAATARRRFRPHVVGAWVALAAGLMITFGISTVNRPAPTQSVVATRPSATMAAPAAGVLDRDFEPPPPAAPEPAKDLTEKELRGMARPSDAMQPWVANEPRESFQYKGANKTARAMSNPVGGSVAEPAWAERLTRRRMRFQVTVRQEPGGRVVALKVAGYLSSQEREEVTHDLMAEYGLASPAQVVITENAAGAERPPAPPR
ncbi:MAG TPA: hypothetical protein VGO93_24130 [Candidatus Xenobia bacterium]|jgi:hypothetical protein